MKDCVIVVGGQINDLFAKKVIEEKKPDFCIAADSGMNFFYRSGLKPDWIIGDFDSASGEALDYFKTRTLERNMHTSTSCGAGN